MLLSLMSLSGICLDIDGHYTSMGYGGSSCGKFVEARNNEHSKVAYATWVTGYMTAVNQERANTFSIAGNTDLDGLMLWIENYCKDNPLILFSNAVAKLVLEIYP